MKIVKLPYILRMTELTHEWLVQPDCQHDKSYDRRESALRPPKSGDVEKLFSDVTAWQFWTDAVALQKPSDFFKFKKDHYWWRVLPMISDGSLTYSTYCNTAGAKLPKTRLSTCLNIHLGFSLTFLHLHEVKSIALSCVFLPPPPVSLQGALPWSHRGP